MADSLGVIGRSILPNDCNNYKQELSLERIFKRNWLGAAEYQHEIANHYRDYKHHKKVRRIRKSILRSKKAFLADVCDYRDVLQVTRIDFPQSTPDFSKEVNQVNYRLQPLNNVYNNTLRRILAANTLSELEFLTKRQRRLNKFKKGLKTTQGISINCSNYQHSGSKTTCNTNSEKRRCSLGHISSNFPSKLFAISGDNKVNDKEVSVENICKGEFSDVKDNYFLHLASQCYDEGFLTHIKYLESIGERNAINNQINKRRRPRHISEKTSATSRPPSAESYVSSSCSVEDLSNSVGVRGFISVVKRILHHRRFVQNPCNYVENVHGAIQHDWKIRVNITRSSSPESLHSSRSSIQEPEDNSGPTHCIMSEFFNATKEQPHQISASNGISAKNQHFHDLIENLNNLEIDKLGALPKIVLTDFSTSNIVTDSGTPLKAKFHENIICKQQSLDVEIPSSSEYNSEARPP